MSDGDNKTVIIVAAEMPGANDQIFSFYDPDACLWHHFNVTKLAKYLDKHHEAYTDALVPCQAGMVDHIRQNNGVEIDRVGELIQQAQRTSDVSYLRTPVLFVEWGNGTHVLIDGNHRYVANFFLRAPTLRARIVTRELASKYEISLPDEVIEAIRELEVNVQQGKPPC